MIGVFIQFYTVPLFGTHLKVYMVCVMMLIPVLGFSLPNKRYLGYEKIWIFSYGMLAFSLLWTNNFALGLQLVLGEIILLSFYFVLKILCDRLSEFDTDRVFVCVFRTFVYASILLYLMGMASIYIFQNEASFAIHLNETSLRIFGCYKENILPRFMGMAESPNNYAYFANIIFWYFVWKHRTIDATITLITLIFTISTTLYLALFVQVILYYYFGGKLNWKVMLLCIVLYYGTEYLMQFSDVQIIMEDRMVRNSTGSGRFELWRYSLSKISDGPIFGYGINQSRTLFTEREYASSHNNILEMGLSLGYLGCLVYIIFLLSLLKQTFTFSKHNKIPFMGQIGAAFFIFGFANNTLHIEYTVFALTIMSYYIRKCKKYCDM